MGVLHVMPININSAQGRSELFININGEKTVRRNMNRASGTTITLKFFKDHNSRRLVTGLDKVIDNPYKGDPNVADQYLILRSKDRITRQEELEYLNRVPFGTYTSETTSLNMHEFNNASRNIMVKEPNMLENFAYYFSGTESTIIDDSNARNRLAQYMVLNHPKVAQLGEAVNPDKHILRIVSAEEEVAIKLKKRNIIQTAIGNLNTLQTTAKAYERVRFAILLGLTQDIEPDITTIDSMLSDYVWLETKDKFGTQEERVNMFNDLFDDYVGNNVNFYIKSLISLALNARIFSKHTGEIFWNSQKGKINYNLQSNMDIIVSKFRNAFEEDSDDPNNWYRMLIVELKAKGVNTEQ